MSKIYEDEFMEVQSDIISLCLELVQNKADKVYAYCSIEEKSTSFNAFFEINGKIKTLNELDIDMGVVWEFMDLGISDLEKVREICKTYKQSIPTEIKMIYDISTGKYDADFQYDETSNANTGFDSSQIFMNWLNEIKAKKEY